MLLAKLEHRPPQHDGALGNRCVFMKANRPVSALARREHLASAGGNVRLQTNRLATAHQQADCSSHEPGNPGDVG
jgi:hypothetical protein